MPLSLEQYADYLDTRSDLPWPAAPTPTPVRAKPHLVALPGIRAVLWNVYGTLLAIPLGELVFEHPQPFIMSNALEKTIQEFKMWASMSRKPGQPSDYMLSIYQQILLENKTGPSGERFPEAASDRIWETILKRLLQKDYKFDTNFYGALNEYSRKVAYFFHASLQATACYPGASLAVRHLSEKGIIQGLLGEGQCFTPVQVARGLRSQDPSLVVPWGDQVTLSYECRGRKPSERLFRLGLERLQSRDISAPEVLHIGSRIKEDILPARRLGMKTALFAGDKTSLQATQEQLKDPNSRPDILLTELSQLVEVVG
ncbi:MAG: HAD family hydrolase [Gemmataceae bacterium]